MTRYTSWVLLCLSVTLLSSWVVPVTPSIVAEHSSHAITPDGDTMIQLYPNAPFSDASAVTVRLTSLPVRGQLYQISYNYLRHGYEPMAGAPITVAGTDLDDPDAKLVYRAPASFLPCNFSFTAFNATDSAAEDGLVDLVPDDGHYLARSHFHFTDEAWTVTHIDPVSPAWSDTSSGDLNHYIYAGNFNLTVGVNNDERWRFSAPPSFLGQMVNAYGGTLSFVLGAFAGDFSEGSLRTTPLDLVILRCDSCAAGAGITLSQRNVAFTGGVQRFSFTLEEGEAAGWGIDPQDSRRTAWAAPTACQFYDVLHDLSAIEIYGDVTTQFEAVGLDDVVLTAGVDKRPPVECYE